MGRSIKAAEYERVSRLRKVYDVQANLLGWTKLDVLASYLTPEGELVVFDRQEGRHSGPALPEVSMPARPALVEPHDSPASEYGPRWDDARERFGAALAGLDLSEASREDALSTLSSVAAVLLRGVELIGEADGPDWRESIGL